MERPTDVISTTGWPGTFHPLAKYGQELAKSEGRVDFFRQRSQAGHASMHEVSIMTEAVRMAVETARASGGASVTGLKLRVGTLSGAVPEAMRFAFDVVCRDTLAEGAWLEIESVPAACWCATCQAEFACMDFFNECPRCHDLSGELRRGRELEIASVEMN